VAVLTPNFPLRLGLSLQAKVHDLNDTHIGPKPCAGIREDVGEASAGVRAGQPLSRDRKVIPGADTVCLVEGNMSKSASASTWPTRRGRRTRHARLSLGV